MNFLPACTTVSSQVSSPSGEPFLMIAKKEKIVFCASVCWYQPGASQNRLNNSSENFDPTQLIPAKEGCYGNLGAPPMRVEWKYTGFCVSNIWSCPETLGFNGEGI